MNFIVIVSDTFRFDNLGCYERIRPRFQTPLRPVMTPRLDQFAQRATVFDNAYIGSFPTVPHRKDLFTGRNVFPWEGWSPLRPDAVTLPGLLGKAGYETMMVQDTPHTIQRAFQFERDFQGWDFIRGQETDRLASWRADQPIDPRLVRGEQNWKQHLANVAETRRCEQDCFVAQTMTRATRWLERWRERGADRPFLLYVDTFDPHEPWDAPPWYEDLYDSGFDGPVNRYPLQGAVEGRFSKREMDHIRAIYAAEVTLVDRWIGFLLDTVELMGLLETTCVIFTADHGYCLGEHGLHGKAHALLYEEIGHVPLLVHLPGQNRPRHVKAIVQPCDLAPTMLELAGLTPPKGMHGFSLTGLMAGGARAVRRYAFSRRCMDGENGLAGFSVVGDGFTLVYPTLHPNADSSGCVPMLFQTTSDPLQKKNVLKQNRKQAQVMWDAFAKWLESVGAPASSALQPRP